MPVAANAAAIKTTYGVDPPEVYAILSVADTGAVTATIQTVSADTNATTITLTPDAAFKVWVWGGTIPTSYKPKS